MGFLQKTICRMREFERVGDQRGFTHFENPLDDIYAEAQQPAYFSNSTTNRHNNTNQNSDELLIDTYEVLPDLRISSQPGSSECVLVDLSEPSNDQNATNNFLVKILNVPTAGLKFDRREGKLIGPRLIQLEPGMMLKTMAEHDWKMESIEKLSRRGMCAPMEGLEDSTICAKICSSDVMDVTHDQALQLLSLCPAERLELYNDPSRLDFITRLKVGDSVLVNLEHGMRRHQPAHISWIGERPDEHGIWYNVDFDMDSRPSSDQWFSTAPESTYDQVNRHFETNFGISSSRRNMSGSSSLAQNSAARNFYSPNQMHMPMKGGGVSTALYDNRVPVRMENPQSRARIIPINRKDVEYAPPERQSRSTRTNETDYYHHHQHQQQQHSMAMPNVPPTPPSRSKSVHAMSTTLRTTAATKNERISEDSTEFRIGDPCIWNNNGIEERGTVKFIGYLKGHKALYAGVEFKNRIGAGTGIFNKQQLFVAQDGHAGFVELSSLDRVIATPSSTTSSSTSSSSSSSTMSNGLSRARVGAAATTRSYRPADPPAYTPPSPPRSSSAQSAPPPIPSKPYSAMEDYLIDSFNIGNRVLVNHLGAERSGTVKWIGDARNEQNDALERAAVVQLDEYPPPTAWRLSADYHPDGVLVPFSALHRNRLVPSSNNMIPSHIKASSSNSLEFGSVDSGVEKQRCLPCKDVQQLVGRQKGIQGYSNSCYLDATLYAMFVQSTNFDFLLEKKGTHTTQFQKQLAQEIVYPLRKYNYVRADHVMKLRQLLSQLMPHMTGLTNEEKDPEEILEFVFAKIIQTAPFVRLVSTAGKREESQYLVPIVVDSDWQGGAVTSQHLLERHLKSAQVQFATTPSVLIMQLPRYGQQKLFDKILPLDKIDITPFVAGSVPACSQCGQCAECYCPTCFLTRRVFYTDIVYCMKCFIKSHQLPELADHQKVDLYPPGKPVKKPSCHKMNLTAVLCIETSHYVAYVKTLSGNWIFFDSMADREGLSDGFNVPVVKDCGDLSNFISISGWNRLKEADETGQLKSLFGKQVIDPLVDRLLSDGYICFYEDASLSSSNFGNSISNSTSSSLFNQIKNKLS